MGGRSSPDPLTEEQTEELRRALLHAREELEASLEATREGVRPVDVGEPIGRLTRMDALQQQGMAMANRRAAEARLRQVLAALVAVRQGDYGYCARCAEPIGYARQRARPETRCCLRCQEQMESRR